MSFSQLHIHPSILRALEREGYTEPTPIQIEAIPPLLEGRDLLGCAQTGTGKTAAFAVPVIQNLSRTRLPVGQKRKIRALVLTPTRELAVQIYESFRTYGRNSDLRSCVVFGGVSQKPSEIALRGGIDVLVATPGRLNDLMNQGIVSLADIQILVLDEADRMLDMGFIHDVKRILAKTPEKKQTLLFSATISPEIDAMAQSLLKDPVSISITPESPTVERIEQSLYFVDKPNKRELLLHILRDEAITSALVFTRTKHGADRVVRELVGAGIKAAAIHGDKSQNNRQLALNNFKSGSLRVLVATDIAARGIDIDELSHVFNFDLPNVPETYVHRIGRTGRAGLGGIAVSFCDFDEKPLLKDVEKFIGKKVPVVQGHPFPMTATAPTPKQPRAPRPPRRPESGRSPAPAAADRSSDEPFKQRNNRRRHW